MATINDVAKRAGVAISTVSHILNGTKHVSDEVKAKVLEAIKELNYEVDPVARNMKAAKSKTIGIIVTNTSRIFFPPVLRSARKEAAQHGYSLMMVDSDDDFEQEKSYINLMRQNRFDGIILDSVADLNDVKYLKEIANLSYRNKRVFVVSIERNLEPFGIDSLVPDNYCGAKMATEHLIKCGCKNVLHITGPFNSYMAKERIKGYSDAMKESGFQIKQGDIALGDFSPQSGYEITKRYIESRALLKYEGIFTANDQMAVGAIKALREAGIKIPDDIKVVGFDDTFVASIIDPPLTTVHVSGSQIGREAMKVLMERIKNPDAAPQCRKIETRLIIRRSTDRRAGGEWDLGNW